MVYPSTHLYCTMHWTAPGDEEGQTGFRVDESTMPLDAALDNVVAAATAFWNSADAAISVVYGLYRMKFALIDASGHYPPGFEPVVKDFSSAPGASANLLQPLQSAAVTSLEGALPRSAAGRGRMYFPPINAAISASTGGWTALQAGNRLAAVKGFLDDVNAALAGNVSVFSAKGTGAKQVVTTVRHGDRPDVQRRRANQLVEVYVEDTLA